MALPRQMKAIQIVEFNQPYRLNTIPVPEIQDSYDMLVKVAVASNCHTDGMVQSGAFHTQLPCTASHEGAGRIVRLGSDAEKAGFAVGQRVMCGMPMHPCGTCDECLGPDNQKQYCPKAAGYIGVQLPGCFAEYVKVDCRSTTRLPDEVSFLSAAPLACAGRTVFRGILQSKLQPGQWVAIVGSGGGLGHLGVKFAKARGLNVIGIDARDQGLALSSEYGADVVIDIRKGVETAVKEAQEATQGRGADSTVCLSDHPTAAATACAVTRMHGTVIQIAQPAEVSVPFQELILRDIRIQGSLIGSATESEEMLDAVMRAGISVKCQAFHGLESFRDLIDQVKGGKVQGKALIIVDQAQIDEEKRLGARY